VEFLEHYYKKNPEAYRDFELVYIGLSKDFLSTQLLKHAKALKGHFKHYPNVSWEKNLEIVKEGNITICYSLSECLPLFVFEGMIAGNPILRNDSSGVDEQLVDGVNGYLLDTNDYHSIVNTIEAVLNRHKTSDKQLSKMSGEAYKIAKKQESHSYLKGLESM
jgi:glycosyltransferase involved in cell wall biosynthesis